MSTLKDGIDNFGKEVDRLEKKVKALDWKREAVSFIHGKREQLKETYAKHFPERNPTLLAMDIMSGAVTEKELQKKIAHREWEEKEKRATWRKLGKTAIRFSKPEIKMTKKIMWRLVAILDAMALFLEDYSKKYIAEKTNIKGPWTNYTSDRVKIEKNSFVWDADVFRDRSLNTVEFYWNIRYNRNLSYMGDEFSKFDTIENYRIYVKLKLHDFKSVKRIADLTITDLLNVMLYNQKDIDEKGHQELKIYFQSIGSWFMDFELRSIMLNRKVVTKEQFIVDCLRYLESKGFKDEKIFETPA